MSFLRYNRISNIIPIFNDRFNVLISNQTFEIQKYSSTNVVSSTMIFLNYLILDKSTSGNIIPSTQTFDDNNDNINSYNIQKMAIHDKTFGKQCLDKETMMSVLQQKNYLPLNKYLKKIDGQCCKLLNNLSFSEIIQFLNLSMKIDRSNITKTKFYNKAILTLKISLKRDQLNHQETFMLLFFASLNKKETAKDIKYIKNCLPHFNHLSLIEKSILSDIFFKYSIKLTKFEERSIEKSLENQPEFFVKEKHLLIPVCKIIRRAGLSYQFNFENLNRALINTSEYVDLTSCGHILNLYTEATLKVDHVLSKLYSDAFANLNYNSICLPEDIDNLVWPAAMLNYQLRNKDLSTVEEYVEKQFVHFKADHTKLLNIILSLWMLQYKPKKLIHKCFDNQIFNPIIKKSKIWKSRAKLQLLINCIKIEAPDINIPLELIDLYDLEIKITKNLKIIFKKIQKMRHELNLVDLNIVNPIKGIHIPSIYMRYSNDKIIYVDLIDTTTCLRNSNELHGLMNIKLRLLNKSGYKSLLINDEYDDDTNKLDEYLHKMLI